MRRTSSHLSHVSLSGWVHFVPASERVLVGCHTGAISALLEQLEWHGFAVASPALKLISDALRWERRYGRVRDWGAACTVRATCRAAPSIASINESWRCAATPNRS